MTGSGLKQVLRRVARRLSGAIQARTVLTDVNRAERGACPKRALIVYLTAPFRSASANRPVSRSHTNHWRNLELARLLAEFGYVVDVVNHNAPIARPGRSYDLVIGLGRAMLHLTDGLPAEAKTIYITTGSEGGYCNQRVAQRVAEVEEQRGCRLEFGAKDPNVTRGLSRFDALICLGNNVTADTYRPHFDGPIHVFNNHGYDETAFLPEDKDHEQARRHFLYFTGKEKLLNGLDLVLQAFAARPELHLHVYGSFSDDQDFARCFDHELRHLPNVHMGGWISVGDETYKQAVETCGSIVVPICAGASHGSVVVCMNNGVIPLVSAEAGIDTDDFGITLSGCTVAAVTEAIDQVANASPEWHRATAHKTFEHARRDFSQAAFTRRFHDIFREVGI